MPGRTLFVVAAGLLLAGGRAYAADDKSLESDPGLQADMEAVKAELAAARANPAAPDRIRCKVEAAAARLAME